jgi:hypothetical protein
VPTVPPLHEVGEWLLRVIPYAKMEAVFGGHGMTRKITELGKG